jgi:hypothetical protein
MDLRTLVQEAAKSLDAALVEEGPDFFLTVGTSEAGDEHADDRTQLVRIYAEEDEGIVVTTEVGPLSAEVDLPASLRVLRAAQYARLYLDEATDGEAEPLVVEAWLSPTWVNVETLTDAVEEVAEIADEIELMHFDASEDSGDDQP